MSEQGPDRLAPEAAQRFFLAHGASLRAFAYGLLKNRDLAEEVVQITFKTALQSAGQVSAESMRAWLYRVAYHEAMLLRRQRLVAERSQRRILDRGPSTVVESPAEELVRREQRERVRQALEQLPEQQQAVVRQRIYDNRTFAEIARSLGVPLGTVLTRMRLALGRLERALRDAKEDRDPGFK